MICPVCKEYSAVQSTRTLVSSGTSNTMGSAVSFPIIGEGAVTTTYFGSSTSSNLAERLTPPGIPSARIWPWVLCFALIFSLTAPKAAYDAVFTDIGYFSNSVSSIFSGIFLLFGILIGILLGILFALIMRAIGNATWMAPSREAWYPRAERVWSTFYCGRDDTMFDGGFAAPPEAFISHVWSTSLENDFQSETSPNKMVVEQSLIESVEPSSSILHINASSRGINISRHMPLSQELGQVTFSEARKILKERVDFPSVSATIQEARRVHEQAGIQPNAELSMFSDPALADAPFYCATLPIDRGGFTRDRAVSSAAALAQQSWSAFEDTLANNVVARMSDNSEELLLTVELGATGYANVLPQLIEVIPEISAQAINSQVNFDKQFLASTGISVVPFFQILHAHRDIVLATDFYRETQRSQDEPTEIWNNLTAILFELEKGQSQ